MNKNTLILCLGLAASTLGAMNPGANISAQDIRNTILGNKLIDSIMEKIDDVIDNNDINGINLILKSAKRLEYAQICLHKAVERNSFPVASYLLKSNYVPVDCLNKHGETALFVAAKNRNEKIIKLLLQYGANTCVLHYSVMRGEPGAALCLLENGVNANKKDSYGKAPLHYAITHGNSKAMIYLLQHGASVNKKDLHGKTALHYLAECKNDPTGNMLEWLDACGADFAIKDSNNKTALEIADSLQNYDFINRSTLIKFYADAEKIDKNFKL